MAPRRLTTQALIVWAGRFGAERTWAVEDCRHLSRRLERDMLAAGERIVRVPPKLMAHARDAARTYGKSDPIDALAVARAALREPGLPAAHLDASSREIRLLVDHRVDLVAERTRCINRLRWHLHEIDPAWDPPAGALTTRKHLDAAAGRVRELGTVVARIAAELRTEEELSAFGGFAAQLMSEGVGAGNSAVVVDLPRCGPMLSPRVPNLVPIPGPRMERETPGQRPRPNYGHPQAAANSKVAEPLGTDCD